MQFDGDRTKASFSVNQPKRLVIRFQERRSWNAQFHLCLGHPSAFLSCPPAILSPPTFCSFPSVARKPRTRAFLPRQLPPQLMTRHPIVGSVGTPQKRAIFYANRQRLIRASCINPADRFSVNGQPVSAGGGACAR